MPNPPSADSSSSENKLPVLGGEPVLAAKQVGDPSQRANSEQVGDPPQRFNSEQVGGWLKAQDHQQDGDRAEHGNRPQVLAHEDTDYLSRARDHAEFEGAASGLDVVRINKFHSNYALAGVGSLTAMACGSALGVPWELAAPPSFEQPLEMLGRKPELLAGEWAVDVQLAICVAEVGATRRLEGSGAFNAIAHRIGAWYETQPQQVPLLVQKVIQWTRDPQLAPTHLQADLVAAGCGPQAIGDQAGAARALRAAARARTIVTRPSMRLASNALLAFMVPIALNHLSDPVNCRRAALSMCALFTADPRLVALNLAYAELVRASAHAASQGSPWAQTIDWLRAVQSSVEGIQSDLAGWTPALDDFLNAVEEPPIFSSSGLNSEDEDVLRLLRPHGTIQPEPSAGFARPTGAGLDTVSALDRVLAAVEAAQWEVERNPELNPVRVGVEMAVRSGGDTDTVAALTGALLGAACGSTAVPAHWTKAVWGWPGLRADGLRDLATGCVYAGLASSGNC